MFKHLRSPVMTFPAMAGGAFIGWWVWPVAVSIHISLLGAVYRGFPVILYNFVAWVGAVLGGATAFAFIASLGNWRRLAGRVLVVAAIGVLIWSAPLAWEFCIGNGRRLAWAVYGVPMGWAFLLGIWGYWMQRRDYGHTDTP
jgi:hypothetical protein